jgi:hypothetical protein
LVLQLDNYDDAWRKSTGEKETYYYNGKRNNGQSRITASRLAVDLFTILKWSLIIVAMKNDWASSFLTVFVWYLIYKRTLRGRLDNSKRFLLLVGNTTRLDTDFVPCEINYAIDRSKLPVIVAYVNHKTRITTSCHQALNNLLPKCLVDRIEDKSANTIHIPFRERIINKAIEDFSYLKMPSHNFSLYADSVHDSIYAKGEI